MSNEDVGEKMKPWGEGGGGKAEILWTHSKTECGQKYGMKR